MKRVLQLSLLAVALVFFSPRLAAQTAAGSGETRNVVWVIPSDARYINGIAIGPFNIDSDSARAHTINGMSIELPGKGISLLLVLPFLGQIASMKSAVSTRDYWSGFVSTGVRINGLSIAAGGPAFAGRIDGLSIAGIGSMIGEVNGVLISPMLNITARMSGLSIAAFNRTLDGSGVQIGFSNVADNFDGVQIGVLNSVRDAFHGVQIGLLNWSPNEGFFPVVNVRL